MAEHRSPGWRLVAGAPGQQVAVGVRLRGSVLGRVGGVGGGLAGSRGLSVSADEPFRLAFVMLALILALPLVEGLMLPRTAGNIVTGRAN